MSKTLRGGPRGEKARRRMRRSHWSASLLSKLARRGPRCLGELGGTEPPALGPGAARAGQLALQAGVRPPGRLILLLPATHYLLAWPQSKGGFRREVRGARLSGGVQDPAGGCGLTLLGPQSLVLRSWGEGLESRLSSPRSGAGGRPHGLLLAHGGRLRWFLPARHAAPAPASTCPQPRPQREAPRTPFYTAARHCLPAHRIVRGPPSTPYPASPGAAICSVFSGCVCEFFPRYSRAGWRPCARDARCLGVARRLSREQGRSPA